MRCGSMEALNLPSEESARRAFETAARGGGGVNRKDGINDMQWGLGELEWQAWMRTLDEMVGFFLPFP
ncbi:hypothetical protein NECAME_18588 [Necator americanus]|uniref:Uncharacterized protein n=1 Tax=Necator americanus TaxID=51031 RepID=W2SVV9_NECAM|nr:hypothetical protein NECAME_18588 [Necator americanus]ETN72961.1 hypothetical protein NECAME_18588 [Necator americanus]